MRYFPLTDSDREEISKFIGIKDIKELFSDIPEDKSYYSLQDIPSSVPENELIRIFKEIAKKNKYSDYLSFLGGGAYHHFIPEVVDYLSMKGEFLTPYTPYQPEVSQGSLQAMFEYQTMMAMLTGMDVSNASLYDGGTAAAEALLLAVRKSRKNHILIAGNLHPEYIEIIHTYIQNLDYQVELVNFDKETGQVDPEDLQNKINDKTSSFLFQSPNFFGQIEDSHKISEILHSKKALSIQIVSEAMSMGFLKLPAENGVDIVAGEAQSFGIPLGYGGPFLGFIATKKEFIRQMPGRIVGQTVDTDEERGYVLTLSTREQHIKREKATSNICSNQAWCALRAAIYLSTMGKKGLLNISKMNHLNTAYFVKELEKLNISDQISIRYKNNFYNELVLDIHHIDVNTLLDKLEKKGILAGIPLKWFFPDDKKALLVNFTELHRKIDIDQLIKSIGELS
jgi:glycine dehydrogenase subunit 1